MLAGSPMSNALSWARQYITVPDAMYREYVEELLRMAEDDGAMSQGEQRKPEIGDIVYVDGVKDKGVVLWGPRSSTDFARCVVLMRHAEVEARLQ